MWLRNIHEKYKRTSPTNIGEKRYTWRSLIKMKPSYKHTIVLANSEESLLWLVCMFAIHHSCEIGISGIPKCRLQAPAEWGMCCESSTRNHRSQSFFKQKFAFKCFLFLAIGKKASKTKLMSHFALFSPEPPFPMSSPFVNCTIMLSVLSHAG